MRMAMSYMVGEGNMEMEVAMEGMIISKMA